MLVSAVDRAPVEVWLNILALAIRSPLIPHPDANLAQLMSLFSYGCASERLIRDSTEITGRLRQVCRSWNTLLQRLQPAIVQCNFDIRRAGHMPPNVLPYPLEKNQMGDDIIRPELLKSERLEMWSPYGCSCDRACHSYFPRHFICRLGMEPIDYVPSDSTENAPYSIPPQDLTRLEVLIIEGYGAEWPRNLFEHLPRLKALAWWSDWRRSFFDAVTQHGFHERLTHLKIKLHWADLYDRQSPLVFRCLRVLNLTVVNDVHCDAKPGHLDLATWAVFPALHSLHLAVSITHAVRKAETDSETDRKQGEVSSLLMKVGPTLNGLILDFPEEWKPWTTPNTWASLPSLLEFGYERDLPTTDHPSPPKGMHQLNILYKFAIHAPRPVEASSGETMFDDFIETCQKWRTRRITMLQTWKEAERVLESPITEWDGCRLPKRVDFYKSVGALGVEICDRDGTRVTEAPGVCFLEALEKYEVRLHAWKPSDGDRGRFRRR